MNRYLRNLFLFVELVCSFWGVLVLSLFFLFNIKIFFELLVLVVFSSLVLALSFFKKRGMKKSRSVFFNPCIFRGFSVFIVFLNQNIVLSVVWLVVVILSLVSSILVKKDSFRIVFFSSVCGVLVGFFSIFLVGLF